MTHCFAFLCSDAALLDFAQQAFAAGMTIPGGAPHGWGLAYYENDQPLTRRVPRKVPGPLAFGHLVKSLRSGVVLGQLRADASGTTPFDNTPPFRFRNWTFVFTGKLPEREGLRAQLLESVPSFIRRNIKGESDVELLFHVYLSFLNDTGRLDDPRIQAAVAGRALASAIAFANSVTSFADDGYCCIASNGSLVLASHSKLPLYLQRKSSYEPVELIPDERPIDYSHLRAIGIVGAAPVSAPGWETVAENAILVANRALDLELLPADI